MIVCSCAVIKDRDLSWAIAELFKQDPYAVVTPGRVYRVLGKKMKCHGCLPLTTRLIDDAVTAHISTQSENTTGEKGKDGEYNEG